MPGCLQFFSDLVPCQSFNTISTTKLGLTIFSFASRLYMAGVLKHCGGRTSKTRRFHNCCLYGDGSENSQGMHLLINKQMGDHIGHLCQGSSAMLLASLFFHPSSEMQSFLPPRFAFKGCWVIIFIQIGIDLFSFLECVTQNKQSTYIHDRRILTYICEQS